MKSTNHFSLLDFVRYVAAVMVAIFHYNLAQADSLFDEFIVSKSVEILFVLLGVVLAKQINFIINNSDFSDVKELKISKMEIKKISNSWNYKFFIRRKMSKSLVKRNLDFLQPIAQRSIVSSKIKMFPTYRMF